jgi:hypothetical protein
MLEACIYIKFLRFNLDCLKDHTSRILFHLMEKIIQPYGSGQYVGLRKIIDIS